MPCENRRELRPGGAPNKIEVSLRDEMLEQAATRTGVSESIDQLMTMMRSLPGGRVYPVVRAVVIPCVWRDPLVEETSWVKEPRENEKYPAASVTI